MLRNSLLILTVCAAFVACKDQRPDVPQPEPGPKTHLIDNFYYAQFTWGKQGDTHTYEVLDDTNSWTDTNFVNITLDIRNEAIFDTATISYENGEIEEPLIKDGWHYTPTSTMLTYKLYNFQNAPDGEEPALEELVDATNDIFSISFPWQTNDTLPVWDIEDYLNNPVVKEGQIKWGRIGNNAVGDTIWNQDAREGVVISYIDTGGVEWRSDFHPTFQPFGYFVISKLTPNLEDGESYDIMEGEFAVRLYNQWQGFKDMRYGKFKMRLYSDIELGPEPQ